MSTHAQTERKFSVALESIQSKRRIERAMEAANALLDRYAAEPDRVQRLTLAHELIRRNFTPEITLTFGDLTLSTGTPGSEFTGEFIFDCKLNGPDGTSGSLVAAYTAPGSLGLTGPEWLSAMRLLAGIAALGAGGWMTCPR
ncbi:hypothetical protein J7I94_10500 [Streptomyces sp. ISL-12]|uniref:hypothetical protein n=1 Tax=Streptomyces sp. ISL-12 TaxID=2819177 RepID=UPI001BE7D9FB|nr:hypothetical protein [Streptomyces sp. ISL-12]MBT2410990.1 hypothetical protein [Streptomyces sp. ISL-12]